MCIYIYVYISYTSANICYIAYKTDIRYLTYFRCSIYIYIYKNILIQRVACIYIYTYIYIYMVFHRVSYINYIVLAIDSLWGIPL